MVPFGLTLKLYSFSPLGKRFCAEINHIGSRFYNTNKIAVQSGADIFKSTPRADFSLFKKIHLPIRIKCNSLHESNSFRNDDTGGNSFWTILKRLFEFIWPKNCKSTKKRVVICVILLISAKICNTFVPFVLKKILDGLQIDYSSLKSATVIPVSILTLIISYTIARFGSSLFNEMKNALFSKLSLRSLVETSAQVFSHIHNLDYAFHSSKQTGMISKIVDRGTRSSNFLLTSVVFNLFPTIVEISMVSAFMAWACGVEFAVGSIFFVSIYSMFTFLITRWRIKFRHEMNQMDNEAGSKSVDSLMNYETVKYFNNETFEKNRYMAILEKYRDAAHKTSTSLALLNFGQNAIFTVGMSLALYVCCTAVLSGAMTIGDVAMVNSLIFQLSIPLNFLGSTYRDIKQAITDLQNMYQLLDLKSSISNTSSLPFIWKPNASTPVVEFQNVSFKYLPSDNSHDGSLVLNNISFQTAIGKKTAIVGTSGSGKTTIVRLLYRFHDPIQGKILINGLDIQDYQIDSIRKLISVVPQDPILFHETLWFNILYGRITASKEEVLRIASLAGVDALCERLPNGYRTQVGERGLKLSGGEKQRVSIARALLKNSPIFVYDEATSSLDSITEKNVLNSLKIFANGVKSSIVIAHRLSTIIDADEILVLNKGEIVERGTHKELLTNYPLGAYSHMWNAQRFDRRHNQKIPDSHIIAPKISNKVLEGLDSELSDFSNSNNCSKRGGCCKG